MQKGEVDGEIRDVERNCQEGAVIRMNWVYNNTFAEHKTNYKRLNLYNVLVVMHVKSLANSAEQRNVTNLGIFTSYRQV